MQVAAAPHVLFQGAELAKCLSCFKRTLIQRMCSMLTCCMSATAGSGSAAMRRTHTSDDAAYGDDSPVVDLTGMSPPP